MAAFYLMLKRGDVPMAYNGFYPPMFPQPCGNIYNIQNSLEVANIPTGAGMTAALCAPENILYLKVM